MPSGIRHQFVNPKSDGADATITQPGDWNDEHIITSFFLPGDISPAQLTANTNDWAPTGLVDAAIIRLSTDATRQLTGLTGGSDGRIVTLMNVGTFPLLLMHDVTSTAANRFFLPGNTDDALFPGASVDLWYDGTSSRWREKGAQVNPIVARLAADHVLSSVTGTLVMGQTLQPGTYTFQFNVILRSATTSVSPLLGINFTGTGAPRMHFRFADASTSLLAELHTMDDEGVNTWGFISGRASNTETTTSPNLGSTATLAVATANTDILAFIEGIIVVTAVGSLELWHSSETATSTSVMAGTSLIVFKTA